MEINKITFEKISKKINWNKTTPSKENVLNALTSIQKINIVILGQDPYPKPNVANGFAFAVNKNIEIPPSLRQIFKEIKNENQKLYTDRTLKSWVKQGVLLLNTSLTTAINKPGSHKELWKEFITNIIQELGKNKNIIWILWGNEAKKFKHFIHSKKIIEDAHPSPLSRKYRKENTFKEIKKYINLKW